MRIRGGVLVRLTHQRHSRAQILRWLTECAVPTEAVDDDWHRVLEPGAGEDTARKISVAVQSLTVAYRLSPDGFCWTIFDRGQPVTAGAHHPPIAPGRDDVAVLAHWLGEDDAPAQGARPAGGRAPGKAPVGGRARFASLH